MPVLVTGAGGFIGSHLVERLCNLGAKVTALVRYNSTSSNGWLDDVGVKTSIDIKRGDIRDRSFIRGLCEDKKIIYNLAALIGIPYSYDAPNSYFDVNLNGALNLLDVIRDRDDVTLVQLSTSEVYGSALFTPMSESHALQPQSPYSASKIAADSATLSYFSAFDSRVILARPFNTYGARQSPRAVIPTIITQLYSDSEYIELGNIFAKRDFCYVQDTVQSLIEVSLKEAAIGRTINIGTGSSISIKDLVDIIFSISGLSKPIKNSQIRMRPEKSEVDNLECDSTLLREIIGHIPETSLSIGLGATINWFKERALDYNYQSKKFLK